MADRVERLTNLLALLLETPRPLSLTELADDLDGAYPEGLAARRGAFERDKAALRDLGVPIETEIVSSGPDAGQTRYRVDRRRYELAELDLTDDERRALQVAIAATRTGTGSAQDALWKLGGGVADDQVSVVAVVPTTERSAILRDAVARRAVARFGYRGRTRDVEPYGLLLREGFWYLIGVDRSHGERRTFRVDRIEGTVELLGDHEFERPEIDLRDAVPTDPKLLPRSDPDDGPVGPALVRIGGPRASLIVRAAGLRPVAGSGRYEVPFHHLDAFRSWVLGLGSDAEVIGPAEVREAVVSWLRDIVDASPAVEEVSGPPASPPERVAPRPSRARPRSAPERLRRLLVMLPWLMERGSVPLSEVAARFDASEREIAADLELASVCGLPPFVDELIDIFLDGETVEVGVPRLFTRPLRLTSVEAFEVLAAARTASELPGFDASGPLARALAKLAVAVGQSPDATAGVEIDIADAPFLDELSDAVRRGRVVVLDYVSASSEERRSRRVAPRQVFTDRGNWYLNADDVDASDQVRTFRIDRVLSLEVTDQDAPPLAASLPVPGEWFADDDVPRAVLRVRRDQRWFTERYPVDRVDPPDDAGNIRVLLPVVGPQWLERLVLRLGAGAQVVEPDAWRTLGPNAARRVLERYEPPACE